MAVVIRTSGNGLQELQNKLKNLQNIKQASYTELFNPEFMQKYTSHQTIEDMFTSSGFKIEKQEDMLAIPEEEWEKFIQEATRFSSWQEMQTKAVGEFTARQLGLGGK